MVRDVQDIWWAGYSLEERFWLRVVQHDDGCWEWTGGVDKDGYGKIRADKQDGEKKGRREKAHRVSWMLHNGDIPPGMMVLHSCDNPPCCNPDHLRLGVALDNSRDVSERKRNPKARWTHCIRGHEFDEKNTYIRPNGTRRCRTCREASAKARRARKEGPS